MATMIVPSLCTTVPMVGMVQQPTSVVSICPAARPADRAPVYLMFLLSKSPDDETVDKQVQTGSGRNACAACGASRLARAFACEGLSAMSAERVLSLR